MRFAERPGASAGLSVICGVAAGALTNIVTAAWSPSLRWVLTLLGALIVVVATWVVLEVRRAGGDSASPADVSIRQRVRRVAGRLIGLRGGPSGRSVRVDQKARTVEKDAEIIGYDGQDQRPVQ